jgi:hypothetical protein
VAIAVAVALAAVVLASLFVRKEAFVGVVVVAVVVALWELIQALAQRGITVPAVPVVVGSVVMLVASYAAGASGAGRLFRAYGSRGTALACVRGRRGSAARRDGRRLRGRLPAAAGQLRHPLAGAGRRAAPGRGLHPGHDGQ